MSRESEVLQDTLDPMILRTLCPLGSQHGFGIARPIEAVSEDMPRLNENTVYISLLRLKQRGWAVSGKGGVSENKRKAGYYSLAKTRLKQPAIEAENSEPISRVRASVLSLQGER